MAENLTTNEIHKTPNYTQIHLTVEFGISYCQFFSHILSLSVTIQVKVVEGTDSLATSHAPAVIRIWAVLTDSEQTEATP